MTGLKIAQKRLISLMSSDPSDHIFRSQGSPSESVGWARGKKIGKGWVGEGKKKAGREEWGKDKKSAKGGVGDDVIKKNKK